MKRRFVKKRKKSKGAHHRAVLAPVILTPNSQGGSPPRAFRLLHGGFPPELAHRHEFEPDPMTLIRINFLETAHKPSRNAP